MHILHILHKALSYNGFRRFIFCTSGMKNCTSCTGWHLSYFAVDFIGILVKYALIIKLGVTWLVDVKGHFIRVYKMLNQLNVVELLEKWAVWISRREDNGLGYKSSSFNLLGAAPSSGSKVALLPYGMDENEVFGRVDRAVCGLPKIHKLIIKEEYCECGLQTNKIASLGIGRKAYFMYLKVGHQLVEESFLH